MAKSTSEKIVEFSCIKHTYFDKTTITICGLHFQVMRGTKVALLGPNGCGKTTLLKHILGLIHPKEGDIKVFGVNPAKDFAKIRAKIGVVLQDVDEQLIGPTVFDDIAFNLRNLGIKEPEVREKVNKIINELHLETIKEKMVYYLSGGEKKKVAIAGALVHEPELLVLDEPFENLDYLSSHQIADYLIRLNKEKKTSIVFALHDLHLLSKIADFIYFMHPGGKIGLYGPAKEVLEKVRLEDYQLEKHHI
jgi:cobalt/nickel transport system ATP-binding protein